METLSARLKTFTKNKQSKTSSKSASLQWPHPDTFTANPQSLAEAGFYFNAEKDYPDNVECFMCGKQLDGWEPDDNPFEIHVRKCPKCPWATARCSLEFDLDSDGIFKFKDLSRLPNNKILEKARLDTYGAKQKWWSHDSVKNHGATSRKMAKAGFVYTPQKPGDDTATCFYCNLSLSGWDIDDDPIEEHRKREKRSNSSCAFFQTEITIATVEQTVEKTAKPKSRRPRKTRHVSPSNEASQKEDGEDDSFQPTRSQATIINKKKAAKTPMDHTKQRFDVEQPSQIEHPSKPSKESSRKPTGRGRTRAQEASEEEIEDILEDESVPLRSRTYKQPPSDVDGKVAKHFADFTVSLDAVEEEKRGRNKGKQSSGRKTRSKSIVGSSDGKSEPSSSRSRTRSRSRATLKLNDSDDEKPLIRPASKPKRAPREKRSGLEENEVEKEAETQSRGSSSKRNPSSKTYSSNSQDSTRNKVDAFSKNLVKMLEDAVQSTDDEPPDFDKTIILEANGAAPMQLDALQETRQQDSKQNLLLNVQEKEYLVDQSQPTDGSHVLGNSSSKIQTPPSKPIIENQKTTSNHTENLKHMDLINLGHMRSMPAIPNALSKNDTTPVAGSQQRQQHLTFVDHSATDEQASSRTPPKNNTLSSPGSRLSLFIPPLADNPMVFASQLTNEEREMTVEQWIRHEMQLQYEQLKRDGERRIEEFKSMARDVRTRIEAL